MPIRKPPPQLLTRQQVVAVLREERARLGLAAVSRRYDISPQQIVDVLAGRANLSKRMYTKMRWVMHELFERTDK